MEAARLPTPHLLIFSGNPLDWPTRKVSFETVIEKRSMSSNEKILYLLQYLSGPPKKIVEGYQFLKTDDAYTEAKKSLEKRFGHPSVVAEAFRRKLENWPKIPPRDGISLREFADFLKTCELAMQSIEDLETLNKQHGNKQLLKILPNWVHPKWGVKVRDYQTKYGENKFPPFSAFVKFVTEIAEVQCLPVLTNLDSNFSVKEEKRRNFQRRTENRKSRDVNSLATQVKSPSDSMNGKKKACYWCGNASHELEMCQEFVKKPINERTQFIIRKGLCLRCLVHGHMAKENKCEKLLSCVRCKQKHPTCLHDNKRAPESTDRSDKATPEAAVKFTNAVDTENLQCSESDATANCTNICSIEGQQSGQDQSLIIPVWVSSGERPQNDVLTYALIDSQSNATFITEKLKQALEVDGVASHLRLSTMHQEDEVIECKKVQGLGVTDLKRQVHIPLPKVYTRDSIPYKPHQIPKPEVAMQWDHLKCIAEELMPYREDVQVGILIGTNCPKAIKPREVIPGGDHDPYGIKTDLGWGIVGRVCKSNPDEDLEQLSESWANKIVINEDATFAMESRAKEIVNPAQINEMFERDFHERTELKGSSTLSVEDRTFLEILDKGIHQRKDGHYEMPLPLRSLDVKLPNNRSQALRRLSQLKARFQKDPKYHRDYVKFMEEMIEKCAEKVPSQAETGINIGELQEALNEMDENKVRSTLIEENCEWFSFKMNPPSASHMGGSWERQIRTVRSVLAALLAESGRQLDDESFRTLLKEIQAVVNSRPLALNDMSSVDSPEPLTPNHLLTMKSKVLMSPPGIFQREDIYLRRRWRRVQHLTNAFWERWRKEFLSTLQLRKKWITPKRNMAVNDVVLMKDENAPRNVWRLARVKEVFPSKDGLVRKVKLAMAARSLDKNGKRIEEVQFLDRPVHKLVLIQEGDREFPDEEPEEPQVKTSTD